MITFASETRQSCLDMIVARAMKQLERLPTGHPHVELWRAIADNAMAHLSRLQGEVQS